MEWVVLEWCVGFVELGVGVGGGCVFVLGRCFCFCLIFEVVWFWLF